MILTLDETQRIKGILILMIIFGHIGELFSLYSQSLLYSFHITSFFFLPFLFNKDNLTKKNLKKNFRRLYIPYTIFFVISLILYTLIFNQNFNFSNIFKAWIIGTPLLLRDSIGLSTFWFFPAFFSLLITIMLYNSLSDFFKKIMLIIMFFVHLSVVLINPELLQYFPFVYYVTMYIFIVGIAIKFIYFNYNWRKIPLWILASSLLVCLYFVYGEMFNIASPLLPQIFENPSVFIFHDLIMIIGFFVMIRIGISLPKLKNIGTYSLAIYTIHPFVIQGVNRVYNWTSFFDGLVKYVLVIVITYGLVMLVYKFKLNIVIYPK